MCKNDNECNCHGNSSFIFGVLIGATIGAVIAVVVYKNRKSQVLKNLQSTLQNFFSQIINQPRPTKVHRSAKKTKPSSPKPKTSADTKIQVILPKSVIASSTPVTVTSKPSKMFLKPKK